MYTTFQLTNLVQGRYVFTLTVSDDQGLTSSDTVSVNVRRDPKLLNLVQMTLPMGISAAPARMTIRSPTGTGR